MIITWIECHLSWFLGGFLGNSSLGGFPDQESSDRTLPWFSRFLPSLLKCNGAKLIKFFPLSSSQKPYVGPIPQGVTRARHLNHYLGCYMGPTSHAYPGLYMLNISGLAF